jgi:hypothetical protein
MERRHYACKTPINNGGLPSGLVSISDGRVTAVANRVATPLIFATVYYMTTLINILYVTDELLFTGIAAAICCA